jgi:hypothetical protein
MTDYPIYRLCRDVETIERLRDEEKKFNLPKSICFTDIDLFEFINKVIQDCEEDYALICHDDVIIPSDIEQKIRKSIQRCDNEFGPKNWGLVGNSGVEIISERTIRYISDVHSNLIPFKNKTPDIVSCVDGNTILLNIKNLRDKEVSLPKKLKGYHLYDLILCMETYKKGLICATDSTLFVLHKSGGNLESFLESVKKRPFIEYFRNSFSNNKIITLNETIKVPNASILEEKNSYENTIKRVCSKIYSEKEKELYIITRVHKKPLNKLRRLLDTIRIQRLKLPDNFKLKIIFSINGVEIEKIREEILLLKKEYKVLDIQDVYLKENKDRFPRVASLAFAANHIPDKPNAFVWIVDSDDFILPNIEESFPILLNHNYLSIFDSDVFEETWDEETSFPLTSRFLHTEFASNYSAILSSTRFIPICSVIYPAKVFKSVFEKNALRGDYFEDAAIFLLAQKQVSCRAYPVRIAGISYHGENTVLEKDRTNWDYSYTTFYSEIVEKDTIDKIYHDYLSKYEPPGFSEFKSFTKGKIWRFLQKYRKFKKFIKKQIGR